MQKLFQVIFLPVTKIISWNMFRLFIHSWQTLHSSLPLKLNRREIQCNTLFAIRATNEFEWSMIFLEIMIAQYEERHKRAEKGCKCDTKFFRIVATLCPLIQTHAHKNKMFFCQWGKHLSYTSLPAVVIWGSQIKLFQWGQKEKCSFQIDHRLVLWNVLNTANHLWTTLRGFCTYDFC